MQNENTPAEGQNSDKLEAKSALRDAACCASSDLDAVKSWGPLVLADVVGGDLADNTVTLRIHGPMPHTILGSQWFLFHDAPPASERLPFPFLHNVKAIHGGEGSPNSNWKVTRRWMSRLDRLFIRV